MFLDEKELKIFYKDKFNHKLDKAIRDLLTKFGYEEWASGYNLIDGVRDLCFDKKDT